MIFCAVCDQLFDRYNAAIALRRWQEADNALAAYDQHRIDGHPRGSGYA